MKFKFFNSLAFLMVVYAMFRITIAFGQDNATDSIPLKPGMARVYFHRNGNLLGAAVTHVVIDKGDSMNYNGYILEKKSFPIEQYNFGKAGNVQLMYLKVNYQDGIKIIGKTPKGDTYVNTPFKITNFPSVSSIPGPLDEVIIEGVPVSGLGIVGRTVAENLGYYKNIDNRTPNCRIVGAVGSSGTFYWDRPAGTMIIENITPGGDQAFAQPYKVEAGKIYNIDYHYAASKFDIYENSNSKNMLESSTGGSDTLTNDIIIEMTKKGETPTSIINKIRSSVKNFDLSSNAIARLNRQLVDLEVIKEMKKP